MNILTIVAHPDDDAIFCGGTLVKHSSRGDEVHVTYLTRGELGGMGQQSPSELARIRSEEAGEASRQLGISISYLDFEDGRIQNSLENRRIVTDLVRRHDPDLLITHYRKDSHPDHRATSHLVTDAYYMASLPMFETEHEPTDPHNVYYFGKITSDFSAERFVDISDVQTIKEEAIQKHQSQVEFLNAHGGIDVEFNNLIDSVRAEARILGRQCGVKFAEGFSPLHNTAVEFLGKNEG